MPLTQVKAVSRYEGSRIQQDIPVFFPGFLNPVQGMLYSRKVGLSWISKQVVSLRSGLVKIKLQLFFIHSQLRGNHRNVAYGRSFTFCKNSNAIDGVMIIYG